MKKLFLTILFFPFFSNSQSIDVFVANTAIEFSGGVYEISASDNTVALEVHLINNIDSSFSWTIERVSPGMSHWSELFITVGSSHSFFEGGGLFRSAPHSNVDNH